MPGRPPSDRAIARAAGELGLELAPARLELLAAYAALLRQWNARVNLVSRRDVDRVESYHVPDSLAAARFLAPGDRAADIGSGGGLPGIPLAIARPDCEFLLVESVRKKADFLSLALDRLRLANAGVINDRAEDVPPLDCDVVLSRLTGPLRTTLPRLAGHSRRGGAIVLFKHPEATDRPSDVLLAKLGLIVDRIVDVRLPLTDATRRFVILGVQ
ncbi:MAG: 16S rRNA (guanine(527)-N(7))-methyltransferase RsmG [bacterium]